MTLPFDPDWDRLCMPRLGVAALTRMAFQGAIFIRSGSS